MRGCGRVEWNGRRLKYGREGGRICFTRRARRDCGVEIRARIEIINEKRISVRGLKTCRSGLIQSIQRRI